MVITARIPRRFITNGRSSNLLLGEARFDYLIIRLVKISSCNKNPRSMRKGVKEEWHIQENSIKNLIANGELGRAVDYLVMITRDMDSPRENDAIIIASEAKYLMRIESLNIYKLKTLLRERSRLSRCVLVMLDDINSSLAFHKSGLKEEPLQSTSLSRA